MLDVKTTFPADGMAVLLWGESCLSETLNNSRACWPTQARHAFLSASSRAQVAL